MIMRFVINMTPSQSISNPAEQPMEIKAMELMELTFRPDELGVLTKDYRLATEPSIDRAYSIRASDLLDPAKSKPYIELLKQIYETSSETAAVSMFAKRYGYLTIASSLYAMTMYNKALNYAIENCHIESHRQGEAWLPQLGLTNWDMSTPADGARSEWRDRVIRSIFADNVGKLWRALSKTAKISSAILWENTAIYVYYLYEKRFSEGATQEQKARIADDYRYLLNEAPAHLFGESKNPINRFNVPKRQTDASAEPFRPRTTCCLYYMVADEPDDYCHSCPKIKHQFL
jgi:ferric iron reductase protein FhuF